MTLRLKIHLRCFSSGFAKERVMETAPAKGRNMKTKIRAL